MTALTPADNPPSLQNPPIGGEMRQKPWEEIGISRATWYRLGKPTTKPVRITQAQLASSAAVGVRSIQRARRIDRLAPELGPLILAGKLSLCLAEQLAKDPDLKAAAFDLVRRSAEDTR